MGKRILTFCLVLLTLSTILFGCSGNGGRPANTTPEPTKSAEPEPTPGEPTPEPTMKASEYQEAPMLKALVDSGELPPVEERLPNKEEIYVSSVEKEIGQYGGDWRMPWRGPSADKWTIGMICEEPLFRFNRTGTGVEPNVAKGYDVNEDATEYTIYLRKGMKWSDGVPFTSDDVLFWWEHMMLPETFGKAVYDCFYSVDPVTGDKQLCTVTKVDEYTVKVTHKYPSPLFLERLAIDVKWFFAPAHFQKTILPEFVGEEKALEIAKEWGFSDLVSMGQQTGYYYWLYPQIPSLRPWVFTNDQNSERVILSRNPYYWKVDEEGKQLPYIDRIVMDRMEADHIDLQAFAGNVDCIQSGADFTLLKENEAAGNYKVVRWGGTEWASDTIQLNQTVEDPKLRELFQDIRFREALSVAVDRNEICEISHSGMVVPQQASVPEGLANYQEGWAQKWIEYDPDRANQLLDEIGLKWDANHKYRTFADGSELLFVLNAQGDGNSLTTTQELLVKYFEAVGIKTTVQLLEAGLYNDMKYANKLTAALENIACVNVAYRPDTLVPLRVLTPWLGHYGQWNASKGTEGVKPEGDVAKIMEYWDKVISSTNNEELKKWTDEIIKIHMNNQFIIGYTSGTKHNIVVKNNFMNVPENLVRCDEFRNLGHGKPYQFWIKQE